MKLPSLFLFLFSLTLLLPALSKAQKLSPEMLVLGIKLDNSFDRHMRGWTRERIVPVYPGENVLIENWKRPDRGVQIAIVPYSSNDAASNEFAEFTRDRSPKATLNNIGDEAWQWGHSNEVAFRRGHVNVFIGSGVELTLLSVEKSELLSLNQAEQVATNKLIACFVDLVILGAFDRTRFPQSKTTLGSSCFQALARKGFINADDFSRLF